MAQVRIADLPNTSNIDPASYVIIERPGIGEGTFKSTVEDLQKAITVTASVEQSDTVTTIHVKDINSETSAQIVTPTAEITDNGDGTCTITITDTHGTTSEHVVQTVVIDSEPTKGSNHMVTSGTIYNLEQMIEDRLSQVECKLDRAIMIEENNVLPEPFRVNGKVFETLDEAIEDAIENGGTVRLSSNASNKGVPVKENSKFTLDLNGYELQITGPGTGSPGTQTLGMQLLRGSEVTIKNGTLRFDDYRLKMGIQNYCNLTLDNVDVSGGSTILYVVSNNFGNVVFKNGTRITPSGNNIAFDAWYGMSVAYDAGVNVTIATEDVQINGPVEFGKANRASISDFEQHASITCPTTMNLDMRILTPPCEWVDNGDGTKTIRYHAS